ncbi:hypothetical protein BBK14_11475 [Parafrankia soli]|uniref:Uncharacterized protein n=1 Tax=Parafrankia soli TaxID=2599596 RepID=A0A1S1R5L7_9ACTN|nr:hypothetical protein [Parafrankia soli]OHV42233.1 hypothetical protein BBK14_11475 [Parafrankia soli]
MTDPQQPYQQYPQQPYPPQQPYGGHPPYQQPPKKRKKWPFVLLGLGVLMVVMLGGCIALIGSAAEEVANGRPLEHPEDAAIATCERDAVLGLPKATVTVTNRSSEASTYTIRVSFQSQDGTVQHGEGYAAIGRLEPAQQTTQDALGGTQIPAEQTVACVLSSVQRTAAL